MDSASYLALRSLLVDAVNARTQPSAESLLALESGSRGGARFWPALVDEAEYHGVAPLVAPLLFALVGLDPDSVPRDAIRAFGALLHRQKKATRVRETVLDSILVAFAAQGIEVLLLKGSALAHLIYAGPEQRPMVDIDLLIRPHQAGLAVEALCGLGFAFAASYVSRFTGRWHHLPTARIDRSGFSVPVELHLGALSPDSRYQISFETLSAPPQPVPRGAGPAGLALGHGDMLRHVGHHAFEPACRIKLKHLYDLRRYETVFAQQIDWQVMRRDFPDVMVMLQLAGMVFAPPGDASAAGFGDDVGTGMMPPSEILAAPLGPGAKLAAIFAPPAWWLHGRYGVPPGRSLLACQTIVHPANMARWLTRRLLGYFDRNDPMRHHDA